MAIVFTGFTVPQWFTTALEIFSPEKVSGKIMVSLIILALLVLARMLSCSLLRRKVTDLARYHHWRRLIWYTYAAVGIMLIGRIWIEGFSDLATFLGLVGAGLAVALHDTIANLAGWAYILWFKPFKVGDRIEIDGNKGDVIDTSLFRFSLNEIGNWIDADHSTGRIVHVPNGKVFREPLANYETGFEYIWHEIRVLITFESDWRKAKEILNQIAHEKVEHLSEGAQDQIRRAAMRYLIYFGKLTPIVYTKVQDSGVQLAIRYIVKPRRRRESEQDIWEAILTHFAQHEDINLAYPTTRFYNADQK